MKIARVAVMRGRESSIAEWEAIKSTESTRKLYIETSTHVGIPVLSAVWAILYSLVRGEVLALVPFVPTDLAFILARIVYAV